MEKGSGIKKKIIFAFLGFLFLIGSLLWGAIQLFVPKNNPSGVTNASIKSDPALATADDSTSVCPIESNKIRNDIDDENFLFIGCNGFF